MKIFILNKKQNKITQLIKGTVEKTKDNNKNVIINPLKSI